MAKSAQLPSPSIPPLPTTSFFFKTRTYQNQNQKRATLEEEIGSDNKTNKFIQACLKIGSPPKKHGSSKFKSLSFAVIWGVPKSWGYPLIIQVMDDHDSGLKTYGDLGIPTT